MTYPQGYPKRLRGGEDPPRQLHHCARSLFSLTGEEKTSKIARARGPQRAAKTVQTPSFGIFSGRHSVKDRSVHKFSPKGLGNS